MPWQGDALPDELLSHKLQAYTIIAKKQVEVKGNNSNIYKYYAKIKKIFIKIWKPYAYLKNQKNLT